MQKKKTIKHYEEFCYIRSEAGGDVSATFLIDPKDIAKFMEKRKKANAGIK